MSQKIKESEAFMKNKIISLNQNISDLKSSNAQLKLQNSELINKSKSLSNVEKQNEILKKENKEQKEKIIHLIKQNESNNIEMEFLQQQAQNQNAEFNVIKSKLGQTETALFEAENKLAKCKAALNSVQNSLQSQKDELQMYYLQRNYLVEIIQKQNKFVDYCEQKIINANSDNGFKVEQLNQSYDLSKNDEIPNGTWIISEFPKELCVYITKFVRTIENIHNSAKVHRVLQFIANYYNNKIEKIEIENSNDKEKLKLSREKLNNFLYNISKVFPNLQITYELFMNNPELQTQIIGELTKIKEEINELRFFRNKAEQDFSMIKSKLSKKTVKESIDEIDKILGNLSKNKQLISDYKLEIKKLKKAISKANKEKNENESFANEKMKELNNKIKSLQNEKETIKNSSNDIEKQNELLKAKYNQIENKLNMKENQYSNEINSLKRDFQMKFANLQQINLDKELQIEEQKNRINKLQNEVLLWKKTTKSIESTSNEKETEYADYKKRFEEEKQHQQKMENEIEEIKAKYETAIDQIKIDNSELRNLVQSATKSLDEAQSKNKKITEENAKLSYKNNQFKMQIESIKEQLVRNEQILETKIKAIELSTEAKKNIEIDKVRTDFEIEKRRIYAFFASNFKNFVDIRKQLEDKTIKEIVVKCSNAMNNYVKQDYYLRRMLGITQNESIEASISNLLMSFHNNLNK